MWDFNNVFLINTVYFTLIFYAEYWFICLISQGKSPRRNIWLLYVAVAGLMAAGTTLATIEGEPLVVAAVTILNNIISLFLQRYIFAAIAKRIIYFLAVLVNLFFSISQNVLGLLETTVVQQLEFTYVTFTLYSLFQGLLYFLFAFLLFLIISKSRMLGALRKVFWYPNAAFVISLIVAVPQFAFGTIFANLQERSVMYGVYTVSLLILLFFYIFLFRDYLREGQLKKSEHLVQQQSSYVDRLEGIQRELRKVHHDYKNAATGLYAQVEAGELEAAQEYISKQLLQLDQGLQVSVQQMDQLANIQMIELKSLLMTKITEAEKWQVHVTAPVTSVPMETIDLLRCIGILLDNGIEAAAQEVDKKVSVVLLQEADWLTLLVKNSFSKPLDLQQVWREGYSTKGSGRGLGLANLKAITKNYQHVLLETRIEDQNFVQILNFKESAVAVDVGF